MTIGTLGTVTFQTDAKTVETFENLSIKKSANFVAHAVHGKTPVQEFTGYAANTGSFTMTLSAFLGVNPQKELDKLEKLMNSHKECTFTLGTKVYGTRWLVTALSEAHNYTYRDGQLLQCTVGVTIVENGVSA